jgi:hypothetical protein
MYLNLEGEVLGAGPYNGHMVAQVEFNDGNTMMFCVEDLQEV